MRLSRTSLQPETLAALIGLYVALLPNLPFWRAALAGRSWLDLGTIAFALAMLAALTSLNTLLASLLLTRRSAKLVLTTFVVVSAAVSYFSIHLGVYLNPGMLRNVMQTDLREAAELITWDFVLATAAVSSPALALVAHTTIQHRSWRRALVCRLVLTGVCLLGLFGAVLSVYQDFSSMMRNEREMRYLITPANLFYSSARAIVDEPRVTQKLPVGLDAKLSAAANRQTKPTLLVLVVGETVRSANWGLSGYARQTTPSLAALNVLNFSRVASCGTDTETSLPCMFSSEGRRAYNERRIRSSESLLHVAHRAGISTLWIDNQSGCKGVCSGLPTMRIDPDKGPSDLCAEGRCYDEVLVRELRARVELLPSQRQLVVLHMLGNHGPAYFKRYPIQFERFIPACDSSELRRCGTDEIVNAYDNAVLYTDHVLSSTVRVLKSLSDDFDTGLVYVSDHGESLGEKGMFLHGIPYAIAPRHQTDVPMFWWLSEGLSGSLGIDQECLAAKSRDVLTHDYLFHSVLGMLSVETAVYDRALDISASCRS